MYPFTISFQKINNRQELCNFIKQAAHWGPVHRKHDYYVQDLREELETKENNSHINNEFSFAGAEIIQNETDPKVIEFIYHYRGNNAEIVYESACKRLINSVNITEIEKEKNKELFDNLKKLALDTQNKELFENLKLVLQQSEDYENLFRSYLESIDLRMIELFYKLAENNQINDSLISIFVYKLHNNYQEYANSVLQKVKNFDDSIKRVYLECVSDYFNARISGAIYQIYGQDIADFYNRVSTFKLNNKTHIVVSSTKYPLYFADIKFDSFDEFSNFLQNLSKSLIRKNFLNTIEFIYKISNKNQYIIDEINKVLEFIISKTENKESIAFACEVSLLFGNENIYIAAIQKATKEGTNYFCYSLQYNLFLKLIELGFKVNDTSQREMLIQFLLFKQEPKLVLKYCVENNDPRLLSIFKTAVKQCYIGDDLAKQIAESISKNNPDKIFEACEMAKDFFMESYKQEFKKVLINHFPQHKIEIENKLKLH